MEVRLLTDQEPEEVNHAALKSCWVTARSCYSVKTPFDLWTDDPSNEDMIKLIQEIYESEHMSVFRHYKLTFSISGISRACSHQLVRHHVGIDFEQQSQRYTKLKSKTGIDFVIPGSIQNDEDALDLYGAALNYAEKTYRGLLKLGIEPEDARFILPQSTPTNLTMTINLEALIHLMNERLCTLAQWEIRELCSAIRVETLKYLPWMRKFLIIKCMKSGICFETRNKDQHCKVRPHIDSISIVPKQT